MAKREISKSLINLKFRERADPKDEPKPKTDEYLKPKIDDSFGASPPSSQKCIVIMEGNPHPALKGRLSFQGFNPPIELSSEEQGLKLLHEEAATARQTQGSNVNPRNASSHRERGAFTVRSSNSPDSNRKRKQPELDMEISSGGENDNSSRKRKK